jgi:hypothetical protein
MDLHRSLDVMQKFIAEMAARSTPESLSQVGRLLQTTVSSPNPSNDEAFNSSLKSLFAALEEAPSNSWPPTQRRILEKLGLAKYMGNGLRANGTELSPRRI